MRLKLSEALRSGKNESNHFKAMPLTSKSRLRTFRRIECSIMSNEALRSKNTRRIPPYCPYVTRYHSELSAEWFPRSETYGNRIEIQEEGHDFRSRRAVAEVQPQFRNLRDEWKITDRAKTFKNQIKAGLLQ